AGAGTGNDANDSRLRRSPDLPLVGKRGSDRNFVRTPDRGGRIPAADGEKRGGRARRDPSRRSGRNVEPGITCDVRSAAGSQDGTGKRIDTLAGRLRRGRPAQRITDRNGGPTAPRWPQRGE